MSRSRGLSFFFAPRIQAQLLRNDAGRYAVQLGVESVGPSRAIMALDDTGRLVGMLVFDVIGGGHTLRSWMTYVARSWRGEGLARELWSLALSRRAIRRVRVTVISDNGLALMRSVAACHPKIKFDIREDARRKLRDKRSAA